MGFSRSTCCIHLFHVGSRTAFLSCHFEEPGWTKVLALDEKRDIPKLGAFSRAFCMNTFSHCLSRSCQCVTVRDLRSGQSVQPDVMTYLCINTVLLETQGSCRSVRRYTVTHHTRVQGRCHTRNSWRHFRKTSTSVTVVTDAVYATAAEVMFPIT